MKEHQHKHKHEGTSTWAWRNINMNMKEREHKHEGTSTWTWTWRNMNMNMNMKEREHQHQHEGNIDMNIKERQHEHDGTWTWTWTWRNISMNMKEHTFRKFTLYILVIQHNSLVHAGAVAHFRHTKLSRKLWVWLWHLSHSRTRNGGQFFFIWAIVFTLTNISDEQNCQLHLRSYSSMFT